MQIFLCPFEKREIYLHISEKNCTFATKFAKTTKQDNKTMANTLNVQGTEITIIKVHAEDGRK